MVKVTELHVTYQVDDSEWIYLFDRKLQKLSGGCEAAVTARVTNPVWVKIQEHVESCALEIRFSLKYKGKVFNFCCLRSAKYTIWK